MLAETELLALLQERPLTLPPLTFTLRNAPQPRGDAQYEVRWNSRVYRFVAEVKARATPQSIIVAAHRAKSLASDVPGALPLVIVPYLSPAQLDQIERLGRVSAIDLCGNGLVRAGDDFLVLRSGQPNQFPETRPLHAIYRGTASLVARALVLQPRFDSVTEVGAFIARREGRITLGTVSKALKRLAEDLVIERAGHAIQVIQADKLLEQLRSSYRAPRVQRRWTGKVRSVGDGGIATRLLRASENTGNRLVSTGIASAHHQVAIATEPIATYYCSAVPDAVLREAGLPQESNHAFPNIELLQTDDPVVYFDSRVMEGTVVASPIQTWLELATGDKRTREASETLRARLLASHT